MKILIALMILLIGLSSGSVQDGGSSCTGPEGSCGYAEYQSVPSTVPVPAVPVKLVVSILQNGPVGEKDSIYTTPGKALLYTVTVKNEGYSDVVADVNIDPRSCSIGWFSWTTLNASIPAGGSISEPLQVMPEIAAIEGSYVFGAVATGRNARSGKDYAEFRVQGYDYASETLVSGNGQFQLSKDVRSMDSGIKSKKDVFFSGSVETLIKNEYLVDYAKGRNPNFQEKDAVEDYNAINPGDSLTGSESFKSSIAFGGIGARVQEAYNMQQMEFKDQVFNLHQTGSLKRSAELKTMNNFTGYLLLDAKQIKPGQRGIKEHEEFQGSFEVNRRILFKDKPLFSGKCFGGACDWMNNLNTFAKTA
jgi:hypothetical protein